MRRGFSLIQVLIALVLQSLLLLFVTHAVVMLHRGLHLIMQQQSMLQAGAQLHSMLQQQLSMAQFMAGFNAAQLTATQALTVAGDCSSSIAGGSVPAPHTPWAALYVATHSGQELPSCVSNAVPASDVLQLKRFAGERLQSASRDSRLLFWQDAGATGWQGDQVATTAAVYWPFIHEVYYISQQAGQPVLMRKRLVKQANQALQMDTVSLLDGIEMLAFEIGIDQDNNGAVDLFVTPSAVPGAVWRQQAGVVRQLRYFAVIRSRLADPSYTNRQTYSLGQRQFRAPADHYRRLLVQSSVTLLNPLEKEWK